MKNFNTITGTLLKCGTAYTGKEDERREDVKHRTCRLLTPSLEKELEDLTDEERAERIMSLI